MKIKQTYPKVKINLVGNLHQEKTIYVLEDDEENKGQQNPHQKSTEMSYSPNENEVEIAATGQNNEPQKAVREVLHQDNIFEIEMQIESDVEGGIDIQQDYLHGYLLFL